MNDQMMQQQMMVQQLMMIQAQAAKQTISHQERGLCVIFRVSGADGQTNAPVKVQCMPDDKVSDVIKKYRKKAGDHDSTKFIFNAKNLNPCLTVAEAGITNNTNIFPIKEKEKDDNCNCLNF